MKVGLIARADDRGLGNITWEVHRNLAPDRTLVVDMGGTARGFPQHLGRYPDGEVVAYDPRGLLPEQQVRDWLQGLDVVYSAETFYDWRLCRWADDAGVATVLHVMPEFHRHHAEPDLPAPTRWWAPTPWRIDLLPEGTRLVPVPVAMDRLAPEPELVEGPLRVLHVAGHRAMSDRNGTNVLLQALRMVREPMAVTLATQDGRLPASRAARQVRVNRRLRSMPNYWNQYEAHDVLVLPRRYGGLCLPVQEAMGAGLAVVLPDCPPNDWWPAKLVPSGPMGSVRTQGGTLDAAYCEPRAVARAMDELATDPVQLAERRMGSYRWAAGHSWSALGDLWLAQLADAAGLSAPV